MKEQPMDDSSWWGLARVCVLRHAAVFVSRYVRLHVIGLNVLNQTNLPTGWWQRTLDDICIQLTFASHVTQTQRCRKQQSCELIIDGRYNVSNRAFTHDDRYDDRSSHRVCKPVVIPIVMCERALINIAIFVLLSLLVIVCHWQTHRPNVVPDDYLSLCLVMH